MKCSTEGCKGTAKRWGRCQRCGAPPELRERALAIYQTDGATVAAKATGLHMGTILEWRREAGVPRVNRRGLPDEIGLTGQEAAEASGASYRQIDYWQSAGFIQPTVQPTGSGHFRRYSPADVERLRVAVKLINAGLHLKRLREMDPDERARLLKVLTAEGFTS